VKGCVYERVCGKGRITRGRVRQRVHVRVSEGGGGVVSAQHSVPPFLPLSLSLALSSSRERSLFLPSLSLSLSLSSLSFLAPAGSTQFLEPRGGADFCLTPAGSKYCAEREPDALEEGRELTSTPPPPRPRPPPPAPPPPPPPKRTGCRGWEISTPDDAECLDDRTWS